MMPSAKKKELCNSHFFYLLNIVSIPNFYQFMCNAKVNFVVIIFDLKFRFIDQKKSLNKLRITLIHTKSYTQTHHNINLHSYRYMELPVSILASIPIDGKVPFNIL